MEDMKQAIEGVLNNPDMMQQIMSMAQAFGMTPGDASSQEPENQPQPSPAPDLSGMTMLSGLLGKANIDSDQQNLLKALTPYMSSQRLSKLKRAMEAAKLAELAETVIGAAGNAGG